MKIVFTCFTIVAFIFTNAQTCIPDTAFASISTIGIYPLPDTTMGQDPSLGINKNAYQNCPFDYTFTVVPSPTPTPPDFEYFEFKEIEFRDSIGNVVITGAESFYCPYGNCQWGGTNTCVKIEGVITAPPGKYYAFIRYDIKIFNNPFPNPVVVPNPQWLPGNYLLNIYPEPIGGCTNDNDQVNNKFSALSASPNPFNRSTVISFESKEIRSVDFKVYNVIGKLMYKQQIDIRKGINSIEFDGADLSNGVYIYTIGKDSDLVSSRFVVNNK